MFWDALLELLHLGIYSQKNIPDNIVHSEEELRVIASWHLGLYICVYTSEKEELEIREGKKKRHWKVKRWRSEPFVNILQAT